MNRGICGFPIIPAIGNVCGGKLVTRKLFRGTTSRNEYKYKKGKINGGHKGQDEEKKVGRSRTPFRNGIKDGGGGGGGRRGVLSCRGMLNHVARGESSVETRTRMTVL